MRMTTRATSSDVAGLEKGDWKEPGISGKEKRERYYCSREWGMLREIVRERCGGVCERCKCRPMYAVHHLHYKTIYRESPDDLQALCDPCHEFRHGKQERDPILDSVPKIDDVEIRSVYLAGRFKPFGNARDWRCQIFPGYSTRGEVELPNGPWGEAKECVPLPDGRRINCEGPWFFNPSTGSDWESRGPHAFADSAEKIDHGVYSGLLSNPHAISFACLNSIVRAELVFAWIDSRDCYGTLVELGYYRRAPGGVLVVATPEWDRELWFAASLADRFIIADAPAKAWEWLWKNPDSSFDIGPVSDTQQKQIQSSLDTQEFHVGSRVVHPDYGLGEIISFSGEGTNSKACIRFLVGPIRTFILSKSPLRSLGSTKHAKGASS